MTEAERERLVMLAEEAADIIEMVEKILQHGYDNYDPDTPHETNRDLLNEEVLDISAVLSEMNDRGDIRFQTTGQEVKERWKCKLQLTRYQ